MSISFISRFRRNDRGTFLIEFSLLIPIFLILLLVGIESVRFLIFHHKIERAAATMADLVSQTTVMTNATMTSLFDATGEIFKPLEFEDNGTIIVSSIGASDGPAWIDWQRSLGDGESGSEFGEEGDAATLPPGLTVVDGEHLIVCEVFFEYEPMLTQDIITKQTIYRTAMFRPRFGTLDTISP
jgi:Flp pilus assembly protein TadG